MRWPRRLVAAVCGWSLWLGLLALETAAANVVFVKSEAAGCAGLPGASCFTSIQEGVRHAADPDRARGGLAAELLIFPGEYKESVDLSRLGEAFGGTESTGDLRIAAVDALGRPGPGGVRIRPDAGPALYVALPLTGHLTIDGLNLHSASGSGLNLADPSEVRGAVSVVRTVVEGAGKHGMEIRSLSLSIADCSVSGSAQHGFDLFTRAAFSAANVTAVENGGAGLRLFGAGRAEVWGSEASANGGAGFFLVGIPQLVIHQAAAARNGEDGLFVDAGQVAIVDFQATENAAAGIDLFSAQCATLCRSSADGNDVGYRVTPSGALRLSVRASHARGNEAGFFFLPVGSTPEAVIDLADNDISGNRSFGIFSLLAADVSAGGNWWGGGGGPVHPDNPSGDGDAILDGASGFGPGRVRFAPWLDAPAVAPGVCAATCFVAEIPALGGWGLALLAALLAVLGIVRPRVAAWPTAGKRRGEDV